MGKSKKILIHDTEIRFPTGPFNILESQKPLQDVPEQDKFAVDGFLGSEIVNRPVRLLSRAGRFFTEQQIWKKGFANLRVPKIHLEPSLVPRMQFNENEEEMHQ